MQLKAIHLIKGAKRCLNATVTKMEAENQIQNLSKLFFN